MDLTPQRHYNDAAEKSSEGIEQEDTKRKETQKKQMQRKRKKEIERIKMGKLSGSCKCIQCKSDSENSTRRTDQ